MTAYAPVVPKPPLPLPMRRSACVAGGIGFTLMSFGWGLFFLAAGIGAFWAFFAVLFSALERGGDETRRGVRQFLSAFTDVPVGALIAALIVAGLVGALIWVAGLLASHRILRRAGHPHPWSVTWAGLGIGVVVSWIVGFVGQFVGQLAGVLTAVPLHRSAVDGTDPGPLVAVYIVAGVVIALAGIAATVATGVFLWWWMAHAMRPAALHPAG